MNEQDNRKKILVVDDSAENIDMLVSLLKEDYRVAAAKNGHKALQMASNNPPDLVLLDIKMPEMDGYEVCRHLKSTESTKKIPVIFVTALSEAMDEVKAFNTGAADYITKPFQPIVVKTRIKTQLELKEKTDMLESMVALDGLTNIYNRRKFDEILDREWKRASRDSSLLSVIMMDIDNFKQFNDNYGHTNGDECLKQVAGAIKKMLHRPSDFLARYGGEEFVALLPGTDLQGAMHVAENFRQAVIDLNIVHEYSEIASYVTISSGVAAVGPQKNDQDPTILVQKADEMLYKSKQEGRNRINGTEL